MRIVISSAGRRVYVVEWFQQAVAQTGINGDVYVLDHDPVAATVAAADGHREMPAFTTKDYATHLLQTIEELRPDLFISLNDHELTVLSQGLADEIRARGAVVPVLDAEAHRKVADKLVMSRALERAGIPTPKTVPLSDAKGVYELVEKHSDVIIKDRWGSGSSGLRCLTRQEAHDWLNSYGKTLIETDPTQLDNLILQPDLKGLEHGLDIITPVLGGPVAGVLARRKVNMRHGETSAAVTVAADPFKGLAAALNAELGIQGTVDVDVIVAEDSTARVIDINPRFGGGYPFNHIAGADVPHFIVASVLGLTPRADWATYRHDFVGAKHEGIIGFETFDHETTQPNPPETLMLKRVS